MFWSGFLLLANIYCLQANQNISTADSINSQNNHTLSTTQTITSAKFTTSVTSTIISVSTANPTYFVPFRKHGAMILSGNSPFAEIDKCDIQFLDYSGISEILVAKLPFFPMSLGSQGQFNSFSLFGSGTRDVSFSMNGRNLNDGIFGAYNPEQFSPEAMDKIQIYVGSDAVIFGDNTSGVLVNFQEIHYDTKLPFTRIWYQQAGYKFLASDGVFSQNVASNVNFFAGFRHQTSDGRFTNSQLDGWNVRAGLRWNLSSTSTISFSDEFTNHFIGTNGGITQDSPSLTNRINATTIYSVGMDQRVIRHDFTFSFSSLKPDSSEALSASAYFSTSNWENGRPSENFFNESDTINIAKFNNKRIGMTGKYEQQLAIFRLITGGTIENQISDSSPYSESEKATSLAGFGRIEMVLSRDFKLSGGVRGLLSGTKLFLSIGGKIDFVLSQNISLFADASRSQRTPSLMEGKSLQSEGHNLFLGGISLKEDKFSCSATIFERYIVNPILADTVNNSLDNLSGVRFYNGDSRFVSGIAIQGNAKFGNILILALGNGQYSTTNGAIDKRFPLLYGGFTAEYEYPIGKSKLRGGIRLSGLTGFKGENFLPQQWAFIPNNSEASPSVNGLDFIVSAAVGNAFIRATYQNFFNQLYYFVPTNPMPDSMIRFSFSWSFFN